MNEYAVKLNMTATFVVRVSSPSELTAAMDALPTIKSVLDGGNIDYAFGEIELGQVREVDQEEGYDQLLLTDGEALQAIRARLAGEFDNPALVKIGELDIDPQTDISRILEAARLPLQARPAPAPQQEEDPSP